jgi:hypothetical protein
MKSSNELFFGLYIGAQLTTTAFFPFLFFKPLLTFSEHIKTHVDLVGAAVLRRPSPAR